MASFAKVTICGYCGRDVELKYTPQGTAVANVSIATTERRKEAGETIELTTWWRATLWGKQAELANQYLQKGSQVIFEGRPCLREYTDREGSKRSSLEVNVTDMHLLDGGSRSDSADSATDARQQRNAAATAAQAPSGRPQAGSGEAGDSDAIPF